MERHSATGFRPALLETESLKVQPAPGWPLLEPGREWRSPSPHFSFRLAAWNNETGTTRQQRLKVRRHPPKRLTIDFRVAVEVRREMPERSPVELPPATMGDMV